VPFEYHGREAVRRFTETVVFREARRYRLVPTAANGQPALVAYLDAGPGAASPSSGVMVIALRGDRVSAITRFDASLLDRFGLPVELPPSAR
jgi:RNA polymerase sigma-70 factor (ECF subfamily)